jgi:uncharacterized membrane protein YhhN
MVYLYITFALYIFFACRYIYADYSDDIKRKIRNKIPVSLLYLIMALLAFFLNTIDGKLVASNHFSWIFAGMILCFYGDILMIWAGQKKTNLTVGILAFLIAHIIFAAYFTIYLYNSAGQFYNFRELIIFGVGLLLVILFITRKNLNFGKKKVFVLIYILVSLYMVVKASSLIEFMNTRASWPTFLGVFLTSISDVFLAYKYFSKDDTKYALGYALILYYSGMAILPFGIYYI